MKSIDKAICIASVLNEKDLSAILRIATKLNTKARMRKHAHKEGKYSTTIKRNGHKSQIEYCKHKSMCTLLHLAIEIKNAGFLVYTDKEELQDAKEIAEKILSEYFERPFVI